MITRLRRELQHAVRLVPWMRVSFYSELRVIVTGGSGLEIGGPSGVFSDAGIIPIYRHVAALDNVVFSTQTVWEGRREVGRSFIFHSGKPAGFNHVVEATELRDIANASYDYVLAAHCLEHIANPVRALREWMRVTKPGGRIVVVLPNGRKTFDRQRPLTTVAHMMEDFDRCVGEDDLTHLPEILKLHDFSLDRRAGTPEEFKERGLRNFEYRCLHHHVFDQRNGRELL